VTVILMSLIAPPVQTGYFATAFRVTQVALTIPALLLTAIWPLMSHGHGDKESELSDTVGKVFTVSVICGLWMSLATALGAGFVIRVIAGPSGRGAVPVLQIEALLLVMSFVSTSSGLGLLALRKYRPLIIGSIAALFLNVALGVVLIRVLGASGGAVADVATETIVAAGFTVAVTRAVPSHGMSAAGAARALLAAALAMTAVLAPIGPVAQVLGASVIYLVLLLLMGVIPTEVTRAARRLR
jgi:O-antigen/teichoic acid export membrane protein